MLQHQLENGLTLLVDPMPHVESVAFDVFVPGGIMADSSDRAGAALILAELTGRGAAGLDSRAMSDAFESKGISHSESAGQDRYSYRATCLREHLGSALELVSYMIRQPNLPESDIESIRSLCLQDLNALVDNPGRRVMHELSMRYYPEPYNRSGLGTADGLKSVARDYLESNWTRLYRPKGSVISIAGNVTGIPVLELIQKYFGSWQGAGVTRPTLGKFPPPANYHLSFDSAQLQIALAHASAHFGSPHYYPAKIAANVLSGGMAGRLFIEVREKRGLCYSVFARHSATDEYGTLMAYAGTTPQRAQETLDVMTTELRGLKGTLTLEELSRAKANIKASLIMAEESSGSRASSNASDWWLLGRVRPFEEILAAVDAVTIQAVNECLEAYPTQDFMLLTLGSQELKAQ